MIPLSEAHRILEDVPVVPGIESTPRADILGRILARDMVSSLNMPPFDKSAMDGFAISSRDRSERYKIVGIIPAGKVPDRDIKKGECVKIMTGAMLPRGADRVVKKEITRVDDGHMTIEGSESARNVCALGEDIRIGDRVLARGTRIRAAEAGMIAAMGTTSVEVYRRPAVGLVVTGDEIVEPGQDLDRGQIYNSNAASLSMQLAEMGVPVVYGGLVEDRKETLESRIADTLNRVDLLLISGGVSMGDYDYVPDILARLKVRLVFTRVAIKPGKPTVLGTRGQKVVFGLPGNPVSTFIIFEVLVKPLLYRMMGHPYEPLYLRGRLETDFSRKKSVRFEFVPARYRNGAIGLPEFHGSAHFHALSGANCLLEIPEGVKVIKKGTEVNGRSI